MKPKSLIAILLTVLLLPNGCVSIKEHKHSLKTISMLQKSNDSLQNINIEFSEQVTLLQERIKSYQKENESLSKQIYNSRRSAKFNNSFEPTDQSNLVGSYDLQYDGPPETFNKSGQRTRLRIPGRFRNCIVILSQEYIQVLITELSENTKSLTLSGRDYNYFCDSREKIIRIYSPDQTSGYTYYVEYNLVPRRVYQVYYNYDCRCYDIRYIPTE